MPNANAYLNSVVKDAKAVSREKFNLAKSALGQDNPDILETGARLDTVFLRLDDSGLWNRPVSYNCDSILENIVVLGGSTAPGDIVKAIRDMLAQLEKLLVRANLESLDDTSLTSGMNLQVLDALRVTGQQIDTRLRNFAQGGQDLMQDAAFQVMWNRQATLTGVYREKLKSNAISSQKTDVIIVKRSGDLMAASPTTDAFKSTFGRLSDFIQAKVGKLALLLLFCTGAFSLSGQNLLADGRRLLDALHVMQDSAAPAAVRNEAAREALVVLYLYDQPTQIDAPQHIEVAWVLDHLEGNALLNSLINPGADSLLRLVGPSGSWRGDWAQAQTPVRERISTLMYTGAPLSPQQYLSVRQSMLKSQLPPLQNTTALRSAADKVQSPISVSGLRADAVLEGLFEFILERAEQEVAVTFFENLLDKKIPQVGWLFPNVRQQYNNPDITYSQSFLQSLREAFFLDLKNLNLTLPELLLKDEYFGALQRDPVFYNLLTVYTIFGLSHDLPLSEAVPLTHRDLYQSYQTAGHNLNRQLADSAWQSPEYDQLVADVSEFLRQMNAVYLKLDDAETALRSRVDQVRTQHPEAPLPPDAARFLANPLYSYQVLIGNAAPDSAQGYDLNLLPQLLRGSFDSLTLTAYNTLQDYDKFFSPPHTGLYWRIAGLELARNLGGSWYNDLGLADILRRWQADLAAYEQAVGRWQSGFDTLSVAQQMEQTDSQRVALQQLIVDTKRYWSAGKVSAEQLQPLILLETIAGNFDLIDFSGAPPAGILQQRRDLLFQIQQRLVAFEQRLAPDHADRIAGSPLRQFLSAARLATPAEKILGEINQLEDQLQLVRLALNRLDAARAPLQQKAWENTRPMLQLTELLSHLFYALQTPNGLMSLHALDTALYDPSLRDACLGLLQQRMSRVQNTGFLSPNATAQFVRLSLEDLLALDAAPPTRDSALSEEQQKNQRLFRVLSSALQLLNRGLEYPLFPNPEKPLSYVSLTGRFPALRPLPGISTQCMNFLYYLESGEHRSAVSSLVRLLTTLSRQIDEQRKPGQKRNELLGFFEDYGDFIAGMVDAKTKEEVESLLRSLADPPGSSRTKRTQQMTVSLNAYVGASAGLESWERRPDNAGDLRSDFASLAPTIPVGFTVSKLIGRANRRPQSFSLHVSVLDLGSMLTYRLSDENRFGAYKLTFKNVFKPGLQVQWNIQKSPFYLGAGWQTGAQFQEEDGQEISFRASRVFFGVGVDVPIRTLYQR